MGDCAGDCSAAMSKVMRTRQSHNPENGGHIRTKYPHYRGQHEYVLPPWRGQNVLI